MGLRISPKALAMTFVSRFFRRFIAQSRGNVTMITALAMIPTAAAIGGGVDFGNIVTAKMRLQDAADSAAINGALEPTGLLANQTIAADKAFKCNVAAPPANANSALDCTQLDPRLASASGLLTSSVVNNVQTVNYAATAHLKMYVLGLVGIDAVDISANAKAAVSINSAEIAFVLDNTGSMSSNNKMTALKASLDTTLASLLDSNGNNAGHTKVALVPFDTQVALSNVAGMTGYATGFVTVPTISCTTLSAAQCNAVTDSNSDLCASITSSFGSTAGTSCAANVQEYTRTNNGTYYVYSASYFVNPSWGCNHNCYYNSSYHYITSYRLTTYTLGTSTATQTNNYGTSSYYSTNAGTYTPSQAGYNGTYTVYNGVITYGVPTAGGYGSGSTTVYMDNNTINSTDTLLGVGTNNWSGCVIDRTQPYDVQSDAPVTTNTATLYPAAKCATNSLLPLMDLTTDIAAARTYAAKMTPAGNTNITIGIQWGMEVLTPTAPLTSGALFTDKSVSKYMIVLTDGLNTQNRWTTTSSTIDARTALACTAAKNLGITVFTVRLEQGNSDMLSACASQTGYYYNLSNSTQISGALGKIMKSIKKVRLTN